MISGFHIGSNFRRFAHGFLPPAAIAVVMLIPLIFGGLFVWSYYDPIGNLNRMPVALVNSDEGDAGQRVVDGLLERKPLDFYVVDADEARQGIADGTYYMGVEIPKDFTQSVTSVNTPDPHQAKLNVTLNETNGFIPTMLGNQAATIMTYTVSGTVGEQVANQLFIGFNTVGEGLTEAADGAKRLNEGAAEASDGGQQLDSGAVQLNDGARTLNDGLGKLSDGATQLDDGVSRLQNGATRLDEGIGAASAGADRLADGMVKLSDGTSQLGDGAEQIAGGVDTIASVAPQLSQAQKVYGDILGAVDKVAADLDASTVPGTEGLAQQAHAIAAQLRSGDLATAMDPSTLTKLKALQAGAHEVSRQLNDPNAEYRAGVDEATAGAQALADGLSLLKDGSGTLVAGVATLKDGSSQLVVGARAAADGSSQLAAGTDQLVVGARALSDGLVQLDGGSGELAMRLGDGATQAPRWYDARLDAASQAAGQPVTANSIGDAVTYFGKGLSPFFLSLALWFGGLVMFMVMRPMSRRAVDSGVTPFRALLTTLIPAFIIGFAQAALLWLVQIVFINVSPAHPGAMFLSLWFVSWVFISIILAINVILGVAAGRLVTMALMSLQLVASNGLYPPEVQPRFIQWVHVVDPMRFSVDMLRYSLFGHSPGDQRLMTAIMVLTLFALAAWVISSLGLWKHRVIMRKDIHPELEI